MTSERIGIKSNAKDCWVNLIKTPITQCLRSSDHYMKFDLNQLLLTIIVEQSMSIARGLSKINQQTNTMTDIIITELKTSQSTGEKLEILAQHGCHPGIVRRGNGWRAHINVFGNSWEDGETPLDALDNAIDGWLKNGRPMDGAATM